MKKECLECIWYNTYYCTENSKTKYIPECMFNSAMNKVTEGYINKEYNIDTSIPHPKKDEDIVRAYTKDKYKN